MTVSSETNRNGPYSGNGSTTVFAYTFPITANTHIEVILADPDGVETVQTLTTHYTVSGVGDAGGGNVTMITAPATGETITLIRAVPFTQTLDLQNQGAFFAETIEAALDLSTMMVQELSERLDRSVKIPASDSTTDLDTLIANILILSGISSDISTVAGVSGDVTTVAGISANVTAVAGVSADVTTVAANDANITTCAANIAAIIAAPAEASNAASSASAASTSASNAATSETNAASSEANAATSETNAASSAAAALVSETNAAATLANAATKVDIRRNLITNPCMQISQENGDTAGTTNNYYVADEWLMKFVNSGAFSGQRIQSTTLAGALDRLRLTVVTPDATLDAGDYLAWRQNVEGSKLASAQFGTPEAKDLVFRFMGNFPSGTYCVALANNDGTRSFVREFTAVAGVDTVYEVTFPGDTSGTWPTGNELCAKLWITAAAGSTWQTTPDAWQAGHYFGTSTISNGMATVQSFEIGDVGLKLDPDGIGYGEFEVPDPTENLRACQRYYWVNNAIGNSANYYASTTAEPRMTAVVKDFPVTMRGTPAMSLSVTPAYVNCIHRDLAAKNHGFYHRVDTLGAGQYRAYNGTYVANARM